jgi:hypothetical protein
MEGICRWISSNRVGIAEVDDEFVPLQISLPPAPEHLTAVIRCNYQADSSILRCRCKRHNIECTRLVVTAGDLAA